MYTLGMYGLIGWGVLHFEIDIREGRKEGRRSLWLAGRDILLFAVPLAGAKN